MNYDDRPWLKSYDAWVEPEFPVPDVTFVELLEQSFNDFAGRPAFHFLGVTLTFADLDRYTQRFARFLADIGCGPGDVVGINLPNIPQYMIAQIGAFRAGCTVTGISPLLSGKEMEHQLNDSRARVLVTLDAAFEHRFLKVQDHVPSVTHVVATNITDFLPGPKRFLAKTLKKVPVGKVSPVPGKTVLLFREVMRRYPARVPGARLKPGDTCLIQYTGGTTGLPKGAEITHRNVVVNIMQNMKWQNHERGGEVYCSGFPFFHIAGASFAMAALSLGNTQILVPDPRNTGHICKEIAKNRPTFLCNVPSLYQILLDDPRFKTLDFSGIKACASAAAPFSPGPFRALEAVVGEGKVIELYGMTETTGAMTSNPAKGVKKIGSVGLPLQNVRLKLVDLETGSREVPRGEQGEIIVQSPQVMKGYFEKPEDNEYTLRKFQDERWLFTGDVAKMDEDGYIYIVDRAKDRINVGGFKVFSAEAEQTLYEHPAVRYCAIVALINPKRPGSELVKAVIQPASEYDTIDKKKLEEDIIAYCCENMAPYKVPKVIEFVQNMPLTSVGKVDKKALR